MVMVASPTALEPKAITPKPEGGVSVSREEIPAEIEPMGVSLSCGGVYRGTLNLMGSYLLPYVPGPFGYKVVMYLLFPNLFNTDAFQCHGKWAHLSGSSDPV